MWGPYDTADFGSVPRQDPSVKMDGSTAAWHLNATSNLILFD